MPDSAVNPDVRSAANTRENASDDSESSATDTPLPRPAQRLASVQRPRSFGVPYGAPTLDLFADDAERATLQAMNTDVRQGTLAGFELPEVFMAAVSATADVDDPLASVRMLRPAALLSANVFAEEPAAEIASLELAFDDNSLPGGVVAGPVPPTTDGMVENTADIVSDTTQACTRESASEVTSNRAPRNPRLMSEARSTRAASVVALPERVPAAPMESATAPNAAPPAAPHRPESLSAALTAKDRDSRDESLPASARIADAVATMIADQQRATAALSRRLKTLVAIVACVLLVTVATGVAQTLALMRLSRENTGQQQRIEQLMLNQQATLASFFDTDSGNVAVPDINDTPRPKHAQKNRR